MEPTVPDKLMKAATILFAQKGFAAVSIRELAEVSKVNGALISYYFSGKEGLYSVILEEQFAPLVKMLEILAGIEGLTVTERLTYYAYSILNLYRMNPFLARFIHSELINPTSCGSEIVNKYISQIFQFIQVVLKEGIANGDLKSTLNLSNMTAFLEGFIHFYFVSKPLLQDFGMLPEQSDETYFTQAINVFFHGISREERA